MPLNFIFSAVIIMVQQIYSEQQVFATQACTQQQKAKNAMTIQLSPTKALDIYLLVFWNGTITATKQIQTPFVLLPTTN